MDREEARNVLLDIKEQHINVEIRLALDMAIEALKAQDEIYCTMAERTCFTQGKEIAWCLTCPHISEEDKELVKRAIKNCEKCEVGNPCLYCKHDFAPQKESEE